jgi:hypothetical protein
VQRITHLVSDSEGYRYNITFNVSKTSDVLSHDSNLDENRSREGQHPALGINVFVRGAGLVASGAALGGPLRAEAEVLICSWRGQDLLGLLQKGLAVLTVHADGFASPDMNELIDTSTLSDAASRLQQLAGQALKRGFKQAHVCVEYRVPVDAANQASRFKEACFRQWTANGGDVRCDSDLVGRLTRMSADLGIHQVQPDYIALIVGVELQRATGGALSEVMTDANLEWTSSTHGPLAPTCVPPLLLA